MNKRKNIISAIAYQVVHIAYGFVLPRLTLIAFGSEINGLISSITQFLSFIALLEGGLGAVVLSELYKPIEIDDKNAISKILSACQSFFKKLSLVFIGYTAIVALVYSFSLKGHHTLSFTVSLVFILSLVTLAEYLFSITKRLYLQASQKIYIVNYVSALTLIINIVIAFLVVHLYPQVHLLKFLSSIAFFIQPLIYNHFIDITINIDTDKSDIGILRNRWSGFAQNLAHFINMNTDIILITVFLSLTDVSVYSIYLLPIAALRSVILSITNSYQSALGKYYAENDTALLNKEFLKFMDAVTCLTLVLFTTCLLLINPFVKLYTEGVNDADYYQPIFALLIVIANCFYCIREPYKLMVLSAGKFRETNVGAVFEAIINVVLSCLLIYRFNLMGIAFGTLIAILYRMLYLMHYLSRDILYIKWKYYLNKAFKVIIIIFINFGLYHYVNITIDNYLVFIEYGVAFTLFELVLVCLIYLGISKTIYFLKLLKAKFNLD